MTDLRTDLQRQRDERAQAVCDMFAKLKEDVVSGSTTAICEHIANELKSQGTYITSMGVRTILKKKELI